MLADEEQNQAEVGAGGWGGQRRWAGGGKGRVCWGSSRESSRRSGNKKAGQPMDPGPAPRALSLTRRARGMGRGAASSARPGKVTTQSPVVWAGGSLGGKAIS